MREMNKEPLISVIMGVYNDQRFLKEAIDLFFVKPLRILNLLYVMIVLRIKALRY